MRLILTGLLAKAVFAHGVVVLDPGHGGTNLGAPSLESGLYEKALTLDLAKRVRAHLNEIDPKLRVVLTRDHDGFMTLRSRAAIANRANADLFVSLHLNATAGARDQRGFETYTYGSGPLLEINDQLPPVVDEILADLRRQALASLSVELGRTIQRHLGQARGNRLDRGVRKSPLDVLRETEMPAVLVEVGFVDHPVEGRELLQSASRERAAAAIARAIVEYQRGASKTGVLERLPNARASLTP